ncbi:MAG: glycosyltransferase family 2 protein [Chitinophagaceae bacterium]|nr:MAG: glycosyltransferase family 2 protein [Chitinophagaceae bacterium]
MPGVYTIIVTYNGNRWIERCLRQLIASEHSSHIIVVDNASTDDTVEIVQRYQDHLELIRSSANLGFGGGNNLGIRHALEKEAKFLFLLNQDAYVEPNCIGNLVSALEAVPGYGILSPLQLDASGKALDPAFKKYLTSSAGETTANELLQQRTQSIIPVRFVNAAAWMIPADAIRKTGMFHPAFIHYGEDNHLCSRMQFHGFKTGITGCAAVIHDRGNEVKDALKQFIRQLRTVPLYTLLDIRKPFAIAWLLGYKKLNSIRKKTGQPANALVTGVYEEQRQWFRKNLQLAKQIRKETKEDAKL